MKIENLELKTIQLLTEEEKINLVKKFKFSEKCVVENCQKLFIDEYDFFKTNDNLIFCLQKAEYMGIDDSFKYREYGSKYGGYPRFNLIDFEYYNQFNLYYYYKHFDKHCYHKGYNFVFAKKNGDGDFDSSYNFEEENNFNDLLVDIEHTKREKNIIRKTTEEEEKEIKQILSQQKKEYYECLKCFFIENYAEQIKEYYKQEKQNLPKRQQEEIEELEERQQREIKELEERQQREIKELEEEMKNYEK